MCLLVVSINQRPDLPFLCMHNRDEDLSRGTVLPDPLLQPEVIFGSDQLFPGSTWMGLNRKKGLFACLNNVRNKHFVEPTTKRTSRGFLVQTFLTAPFLSVDGENEEKQRQIAVTVAAAKVGEEGSSVSDSSVSDSSVSDSSVSGSSVSGSSVSGSSVSDSSVSGSSVSDSSINSSRSGNKKSVLIQPLGGFFPGFSMLHCNLFSSLPLQCMLLSNRPHPSIFGEEFKGSAELGGHAILADGCHAMSNSFLDDFSWPKVRYIREEVDKMMKQWPPLPADPTEEKQTVLALVSALVVPMSFTEAFDSSLLPDPSYSPLDAEREAANQRVFIPHDHGKALPPLEASGTRSQTLVLRTQNHVYFFCRSTDDYPTMGEWIYSVDAIPSTPSSVELAPLPKFLATGKRTADEAGV